MIPQLEQTEKTAMTLKLEEEKALRQSRVIFNDELATSQTLKTQNNDGKVE